jgi:hypothetical protein
MLNRFESQVHALFNGKPKERLLVASQLSLPLAQSHLVYVGGIAEKIYWLDYAQGNKN